LDSSATCALALAHRGAMLAKDRARMEKISSLAGRYERLGLGANPVGMM
jgi:hypothetical protein